MKRPSFQMFLNFFCKSRTQSPQASWSAGGRRERLGDNGIDLAVNDS